MRAVVVREFGPSGHRIEDLPDPEPAAGEVAIAVEAAGLNFPDLLVVEGRYQVLPALPFVPGKELAGRVVAVGAGAGGLAVGQRVMATVETGAFAGRVVVPAGQCVPVPAGIAADEAAALGLAYLTAYFALIDRAGFAPGDRVLVTGATGAVGTAAVHLVRALGGRAFAGIGSPAKRDAAAALGAEAVIDFSGSDARNAVRDQVRAAAGPEGVDIVLDMVGGAAFDAALRCLGWRGRLIVVGFASGTIPSVAANYLLVRQIGVLGMQLRDFRIRQPDRYRAAQEEILALRTSGRLPAPPIERFALADFEGAFACIRERRAIGKLVLVPGP